MVKVKPNIKKSAGPKDAPGPKIPRAKINKHPQKPPAQPAHPELHTQQLNPIADKKYGQPQYKDETPLQGKHLRALIAHLKSS